jgi:rSAM/selenodomain-associated transferase 1
LKNNAFILFLKYPLRGAVKTRLAGVLGNDLTYELYCCFIADISAMTRQVKAQTIIMYSGPEGVSFSDFPGVKCILQRGNNIGERMHNAFLDVFALGFESCILTGSDSPDLPAILVNDAFDKLESTDIVIGPSADGGYYLIGCKRQSLNPSIFHDINWSTNEVYTETIKLLDKTERQYLQLQQWADIDEFDDLKNFYKRNIFRSEESQVMKFLITNGIINENQS